jgi:hypothetical protein
MRVISANSKHRALFSGRRYAITPSRPKARSEGHVWWSRPQPILLGNYPFLRQKICLMALIEAVFARGAYDRTMSFQTISEETRLPLDEVEHLIMKALRWLLLLYYLLF